MTAAVRLAKAEGAYAAAKATAERADARAEANTVPEMAAVSGIRRKPSRRADDRRFGAYSAAAAAYQALSRAESELEQARRAVERETRDAETRATVTPDRIKAATFIRTRYGWERVIRHNPKSVTVEANWPMDPRRIPLDDILEVRP